MEESIMLRPPGPPVSLRRITTTWLAILSLLVIGACSNNPRSLQITDTNKDSFLDHLKSSKALTVEELALLSSLQSRRAGAKTFGGEVLPIVGKTVGELINEERKFKASRKQRRKDKRDEILMLRLMPAHWRSNSALSWRRL
jgi:hypothetical protein